MAGDEAAGSGRSWERWAEPAPAERLAGAAGFGYAVAELLGIAAEHGVSVPGPVTHQGLVRVLGDAGVPLPPKLPGRR